MYGLSHGQASEIKLAIAAIAINQFS